MALPIVTLIACLSINLDGLNGQSLPRCPATLVSYWTFDDGTAKDIVGKNDGTIFGATPVPGQVGGALSFDGVTNFVRVPDSPSLNLTEKITVEFWFGYRDLNIFRGLLAKRDGSFGMTNYGVNARSDKGIGLYYNDLTGTSATSAEAPFEVLRTPVPSANLFHHFAGTYRQVAPNTVHMEIYLDGALHAEVALPGNLAQTLTSAPLFLGRSFDSYSSEHFDGVLDEVAIYHEALDAATILQHYHNGLSGLHYCSPLPEIQPPVARCKDVVVPADNICRAPANINDGSFDPNGEPITMVQSPAGPYPLGLTNVGLTVANEVSAATCTAKVNVVDITPPVVTAALTPVGHIHSMQGTFQVHFSAKDNCDVSLSILSVMAIPSGINDFRVKVKTEHKGKAHGSGIRFDMEKKRIQIMAANAAEANRLLAILAAAREQGGVAVREGQHLRLQRTGKAKIDFLFTDGRLVGVKAPHHESFRLLVRAQDASGNVGQAVATAMF